MARGIDSATALKIQQLGWTLGRLQQAGKDEELRALGLSPSSIADLRGGARPAIPADTLTRVLFANRFTCCVCRSSDKAIIVHHIEPWATSHDHSEENLAVLCHDDHEKAHRVSSLGRNLDHEALTGFKRKWEAFCAVEDRRAILHASRLNYDAWLYFNHFRLFELARLVEVNFTAIKGYASAHAVGLIDDDGNLRARPVEESWMYSGAEGMALYEYVHGIFEAVLEQIVVRNLSDYLDRSTAPSLLAPGDFILVHGAHIFKCVDQRKQGPGQTMRGRRRANQVTVRFTFDRWEATSSSAWGDWLRGRQSVASLVQVKHVERQREDIVISGTVIAIGQNLRGLQTRNYSRRYNLHSYDPNQDADMWSELEEE